MDGNPRFGTPALTAATAAEDQADREPIPVLRPRLPGWRRIAAYIRDLEEGGWYSNFGPLERRLRTRLADRFGCEESRLVTTSSATSALTGLVALSDFRDWEVPAFAFPAAGHAVLQAGRRLHLVDIAEDTLRISPRGRRDRAGRIDVLPFGAAVSRGVLESEGPGVVIDAAASLGAANAPLSLLRPEDSVVFSLHATKVLGCGEGGVAVCGSDEQAQRLRAWTNFGFQGSREAGTVATNAKMSEYSAAVAHAALDEWPLTAAAWREAQSAVRSVTAALGIVTLPPAPPDITPYCIGMWVDADATDRVEHTLATRRIATRRWWARGLHRMPAFASLAGDHYPVTDAIAARCLGLPVFPGIDSSAVTRLQSALMEAVCRDSVSS
jgi:dTDP-4-amino-4,6-dideoxygalactose transaminase